MRWLNFDNKRYRGGSEGRGREDSVSPVVVLLLLSKEKWDGMVAATRVDGEGLGCGILPSAFTCMY